MRAHILATCPNEPGPVFVTHRTCSVAHMLTLLEQDFLPARVKERHYEVHASFTCFVQDSRRHVSRGCDGSTTVDHRRTGQKLPAGAEVVGLFDTAGDLHLATEDFGLLKNPCDPLALNLTVRLKDPERDDLRDREHLPNMALWLMDTVGLPANVIELAEVVTLDAGADGTFDVKNRRAVRRATGIFASALS